MNALRLPAALVAIALLCSLGMAPVQAQAVAHTDVTSVPCEFDLWVPTKDAIEHAHFIGETRIVSHTTVNRNQGMVHMVMDTHGVGVGPVTGDKYEYMNAETLRWTFDRLPVEQTYVHDFRCIGPGPDNNWLIHATIHWTINAKGELTANVVNVWSDIM